MLVGLPRQGIGHLKASTYTGQHNIEKRGHTSMSLAEFEPTIPVFELSETVRKLDCAVTGVGFIIANLTFLLFDSSLSLKIVQCLQ